MGSLFKPVMVNNKKDLDIVSIIDGQYIVVIDANELYLDKGEVREKVSQNIYIQVDAPTAPKNGDIWFQTEE